jgi:hypothetical protein
MNDFAIRRKKRDPIDKISRREFFESGFKLTGLAALGGPWLKRPSPSRVEEQAREVLPPDSSPEDLPGRFFGAQTHFGQHRPGADELLDLVREAGLGWIRDEVYWSEVEKEKGVFRFPPAYDHYLGVAQARGLQVLLILDFGNAAYTGSEKGAPATEAERAAFARYCREVVKRYKPLGVRTYEIWNEPNASTFWRPQPHPGDYARLLEVAYNSCKEADPGATVLGCSTAGTDLEFIGRVLDAGGGRFMDALSFHPYCQPLPPEKKLLTDISKLKGLAPGKPLWITEFGYSTHSGPAGVDEESQANYAVRAFLLARTSPAVERVFWYDFQNDGEDRDEAEFNFGLVRRDGTPKPAYRAAKTMASWVKNLPLADFQTIGNTYILKFGGAADQLTAAWRLGGTESVEIPCPNGLYQIIERDGESRNFEVTKSVLELSVSEKPRYVVRI